MTHIKSAALLIAALSICVTSIVAQEAMSESYFQAALEASQKNNYSEAVRFAKLGLTEVERLRAANPEVAHRQMIRGKNLLSGALIELKNYPEAERIKREEILLLERIRADGYPEFTTNYPMSLESLGFVLTEQNKFAEAEEVYRKALTFREKVYGASHKTVATSLTNLGNLYLRQGKSSEAEVVSRRALSLLGSALENRDLNHGDIQVFLRAARNLALIDVERKKYPEAEKTYQFIISAIEEFYGRQDLSLAEPLQEYAKLLRVMQRPDEASKVEGRVRRLNQK